MRFRLLRFSWFLQHKVSMGGRFWDLNKTFFYYLGVHLGPRNSLFVCSQSIFKEPFKTCWAYALRTDAYPEHTDQELMRLLRIRISSWCVPWTYCMHQFLMGYAQHKLKIPNLKRSLQNMLIMCVRNWCMHWACTVKKSWPFSRPQPGCHWSNSSWAGII